MPTLSVNNNQFEGVFTLTSQTNTNAIHFDTAGTFIDKDIDLSFNIQSATISAAATSGITSLIGTAVNIIYATSDSYNNAISLATGYSTATLSVAVTCTQAGFVNTGSVYSTTQNLANNTTSYYIQGVTLNKPASGEAKFSITIPNGAEDMITFVFHADSSGNVVIDNNANDIFIEPTYTCTIRSSNSNNQNSSVTYNNNVYYTTGNSFTYHAGDNLFIQGTASQTDAMINIWNASNQQYNGASHNLYASYNYTLPAQNIIIDIDAGIFTEINVYEQVN